MTTSEVAGKIRVTCWNCRGDVFVGHDCGEDTCCCLNPVDNVVCDVCEGKGYWLLEATRENFKALAESSEELEYEEMDP